MLLYLLPDSPGRADKKFEHMQELTCYYKELHNTSQMSTDKFWENYLLPIGKNMNLASLFYVFCNKGCMFNMVPKGIYSSSGSY